MLGGDVQSVFLVAAHNGGAQPDNLVRVGMQGARADHGRGRFDRHVQYRAEGEINAVLPGFQGGDARPLVRGVFIANRPQRHLAGQVGSLEPGAGKPVFHVRRHQQRQGRGALRPGDFRAGVEVGVDLDAAHQAGVQ